MKLHAARLPVMPINLKAMSAAAAWIIIESTRMKIMGEGEFITFSYAPFSQGQFMKQYAKFITTMG